MKRFLLFNGSYYHPSGGWWDFNNDFELMEQAIAATNSFNPEFTWWHIIDTTSGEIVSESK